MNKKHVLAILLIIAVIALGYWYGATQRSAETQAPAAEDPVSGERIMPDAGSQEPAPAGKLKAANFSGTLEAVNTGCFADGECYVVVDGRHVTAIMGWSRETVGSIKGVESFGDLESHIGEEVDVYAQDTGDGTYTLYGSEGFYIEAK